MKIFYWPASSQDGTFLYRVKMQRDALLERGHEVQCSQTMGTWALREADVVVGQRITQPGPLFRWQQMLAGTAAEANGHRPKLVYEIDDDLLAVNTIKNPLGAALRTPEARRVMVEAIRSAHLVTASTEPLARSMRKINSNVVVLPNSLPSYAFDTPLSTRRGKHGPVLIGWHGSHTHEFDWLIARDAVREALTANSHVLLQFLGMAYPQKLPVNKIKHKPWTTDLPTHYKRVAAFDIGLAPLESNPFCDAKSGLKFMEYAALGVPSICSRVPAYADLVEHGVTGYLASTPQQWHKYLTLLINEPEARLEIGDNARAAARAWTIDERITMWEKAYASLLEG